MTKFDHPPLRSLIRSLRSQFANWMTLGALSFVVLQSRCPPREGWPRLGQLLRVKVRLRNQLRARCRLNEFAGFVEVWVYREYDVPGLRWDEVRTIVDVGANVGAATLWFATRAPQARIVAVEPARDAVSSLTANVEANGLSDRVQVVPAGLGATSGIGYLAPAADSACTTVGTHVTEPELRVPVKSLRDLLEEMAIEELDLLKLDCEGAEFEILLSSKTLLPSIRAIVGEFHATQIEPRRQLEEILVGSGFDCHFLGGEDFGLFAAVRVGSRASRATAFHASRHARG